MTPVLGGPSQDLVQWLITLVIVSHLSRVVGPLPNLPVLLSEKVILGGWAPT